ncbi:uncharacterized protein At2g34160-like isoform X3 [Curcuma longa]|uniref:uncharacterized protein At2g34160-like isoform X3 n=1 Tax=Curcuma longa TaxID=136217 RepID=UPI003D9E2256
MEEVTEGVNNIQISDADGHKKNRIQVSNTKKPLFFYVNLAKRYMQQHNEVELSALGMETQSYHSVNSFIILLLRHVRLLLIVPQINFNTMCLTQLFGSGYMNVLCH